MYTKRFKKKRERERSFTHILELKLEHLVKTSRNIQQYKNKKYFVCIMKILIFSIYNRKRKTI